MTFVLFTLSPSPGHRVLEAEELNHILKYQYPRQPPRSGPAEKSNESHPGPASGGQAGGSTRTVPEEGVSRLQACHGQVVVVTAWEERGH